MPPRKRKADDSNDNTTVKKANGNCKVYLSYFLLF